MLDLALFAFVGLFILLGFRRPFLWVLAYLYIDILAPQKIGWAITPMFPISFIAFCAAFAGWILTDSKKGAAFTVRQGIMLALLLYCGWTTLGAAFPVEAQFKWEWVWKAMVFAIFLPLTLTTKLRLEAALLVMVLTLSAIVIATGLKTVGGGGGYESLYYFVNDNSGLYESSTLATVAIASIPIMIWFTRYGTIFTPDWRVKAFAYALIFASLLIPVGTEARTGLLCIAALGALALRVVKKPVMFIVAGGVLGLCALPFLPQSYYDRMATIGSPEGDESASTRVAVWAWTIDYAAEHPMGGGFDAYRANKFTYDMPVREGEGNTVAVEYVEVTDEARAYHSAIFEMLGEQGYPGLALWILLHVTGLWQMEKLARRFRNRVEVHGHTHEAWLGPLATALQFAQVVYLVGALFQGIAYQPFVLMLIALQCALWTYARRIEKAWPVTETRARQRRAARRNRNAVTAGDAALR
ncbi:DUF5935 domain-containing protein [Qipengyuania sp. JC766]|uniref:DUF5935 domain-containing protein n=1 Tax=Qipengyuania sp. JC766 TaxID=3232139 RepID=UPI00345931A2